MYIDTKPTKTQITRLLDQIKLIWVDLPQQVQTFAPTDENDPQYRPTKWLVDATRRAWPILKRFGPSSTLTTKDQVFTTLWSSPLQVAKCLFDSYGLTRRDAKIFAELPQRTPPWYLIRDGWVTPEFVAFLESLNNTSTAAATAIAPWSHWVENPPVIRAPETSSSIVGQVIGKKRGYVADGGLKAHGEMLFGKAAIDASDEARMLAATQRGTAMEPTIMEETELTLNAAFALYYGDNLCEVSIEEVGLQISIEEPCKAASPDGKITLKRLLGLTRRPIEAYERLTDELEKELWQLADKILLALEKLDKAGGQPKVRAHLGLEMKCKADPDSEPYDVIPDEYYAQIEHTMDITGLKPYVFVCHSADAFSVSVFEHGNMEWATENERIREFYWHRLWPSLVLKTFGYLNAGLILPCYNIYASNLLVSTRENETMLTKLEHELQTHCGMVVSYTRAQERASKAMDDIDYDALDF
jgi:hypothetical protein